MKLFYLLPLLCIVLFGCSKSEDSNQPDPDIRSDYYFEPVTANQVSKETRVLNSNGQNEILSVSPTAVTIQSDSKLSTLLKADDIIVSNVSAKFPNGTLRRILSKEVTSKGIAFYTRPASLNEVFLSAEINIHESLTDTTKLTGGRATDASLKLALSHSFDVDGNAGTTTDKIQVDLSAEVVPELSFEWRKRIDELLPNYVRIGLDWTADARVKMLALVDRFGKNKELLSKPIDLGQKVFLIYGVPIVFRPVIKFYSGFSIKNPVEFDMSFSLREKYSVEGVYNNGGWSTRADRTQSEVNFSPPVRMKNIIQIHSDFFNPELEIQPYDFEGVHAFIGGKVGGDIEVNCETEKWTTDLFLKGEVGVRMDFAGFLGIKGYEFSNEFDIYRFPLETGSPICNGFTGTILIETLFDKYRVTFQQTGIPEHPADFEVVGILSHKGTLNGHAATLAHPTIAPSPSLVIIPSQGSGEYVVRLDAIGMNPRQVLYGSGQFSIGFFGFDEQGRTTEKRNETIPIPSGLIFPLRSINPK